jgi:glycosyltransferase involved in cell wall biosynthesis
LGHWLHSGLLRLCVRLADATIFTQSYYRDYLLGGTHPNSLIAPASWIDEANLVSERALCQRWQQRPAGPLRLLFAARLIEDKGVRRLLEAIDILANKGVELMITLLGDGELAPLCCDFANRSHGTILVDYQPAVEYGAAFFRQLGQYDALLIPNLKEEQPRILFDAFSQGVTVIAADTSGIRDLARDGDNALLFRRGDAVALASVIQQVAAHPERLMELGVKALASVQGRTHIAMHQERMAFFARAFRLSTAEATDA